MSALADNRGRPVAFALTPGNAADITLAEKRDTKLPRKSGVLACDGSGAGKIGLGLTAASLLATFIRFN